MSDAREVVVIDIKIPFWSMVVLLVKWSIAAIPAFIILVMLGTAASWLLAAFFHWPWMGRGMV